MKHRQIILFSGALCLVLLLGTASYIHADPCSCYFTYEDCGYDECTELAANELYVETDTSTSYTLCTEEIGSSKTCTMGTEIVCAEGSAYRQTGCSDYIGPVEWKNGESDGWDACD